MIIDRAGESGGPGMRSIDWPHRLFGKLSNPMKGDDTMELVLKKDMEILFGDTKKLKQGLKVLEKDHTTWNRDRERNDVATILDRVKGLEFDVSTLMSDCVSLSHENQNNSLKGDLNRAFKGLNTLFEDLKTVRNEIDQSYVAPGEFAQLEIDWARFRKTVDQIQEDLRQG